jgi:two-component system, OmpR family, sensor histidine kinase KdpD
MVFGLLALATIGGLALDPYVSLTSEAMLYVVAVVVAAYRLSWAPAFASAFGAVVLLNLFFIPPRFTFRVEATENLFALLALLAAALVISHLGTAVRRETQLARLNERRARQLQELATELASTGLPAEILALAHRFLAAAFPGPCLVALLSPAGDLELQQHLAWARDGMQACIREAATLGPGTGRWPGLDAWYLPLGIKGHFGGAACVQNVSAHDDSGREHAQALCSLVGEALWRLRLDASARSAQQESQWHLVQSTFLAAISHDLRTPLAAILGAATSLQTQREKLPGDEQERLLSIIASEAQYLSNVTENTLQLVRLKNAGKPNLDWQSMEEIVGSVLARVRGRDTGRRIRSKVPAGLLLIRGDAVLLEQLLENLLDNALKYSSEAIDLVVTQTDHEMHVAVEDRGSGLPAGAEVQIFAPYQRSDRSGQRGAGLGLAVCRAIAQAHGGTLTAQAREGGGSRFALTLPIEVNQPSGELA